jgi:hypothetical protein
MPDWIRKRFRDPRTAWATSVLIMSIIGLTCGGFAIARIAIAYWGDLGFRAKSSASNLGQPRNPHTEMSRFRLRTASFLSDKSRLAHQRRQWIEFARRLGPPAWFGEPKPAGNPRRRTATLCTESEITPVSANRRALPPHAHGCTVVIRHTVCAMRR